MSSIAGVTKETSASTVQIGSAMILESPAQIGQKMKAHVVTKINAGVQANNNA